MAAGHVSGGYFPLYPHPDSLPDPDIRTFITNFYRISDRTDANELWVSYFTPDAKLSMGRDEGRGHSEIRALRHKMWDGVQGRKHSVHKVFPARFQGVVGDAASPGQECELMLHGEVQRIKTGGGEATIPWASHMVLRKVSEGAREEWKLADYRVWLQT